MDKASSKQPVSVVIVAYESSGFIDSAITSAQRNNASEIIIIDNAADPACAAICESLNVRYFAQPKNLGFGYGCNIGVSRARQENTLGLGDVWRW